MRFFTLDWWLAQQHSVPPDPFEAYETHLREIEPEAPAALVALWHRGVLHDAKLRRLHFDTGSRSLEIEVTAYELSGEHVGIVLRYGGVRSITSTADPEGGLPGPYGYGDLGYNEIHVIDGKPEHWLLFSSGIEVQVAFETFEERRTTIKKDAS